jgi:hypothetical protein
MLPNRPSGITHINPEQPSTGSDTGTRILANPGRQRRFFGLGVRVEISHRTRTNFSAKAYTLNTHKNLRSLWVEFKYLPRTF